ncbi:energy transducer TonB [Prolixibacteraceae bacterium Z1-6]|uniref:Energy transducer TonB n=1 Tax=Draconibacterium aestuarii TaxID=2998507 RepID=A0A9X3J5X9_9BACT|nr:energy transducer TonB [Prolixibacteraceae bacterium Z1-6]
MKTIIFLLCMLSVALTGITQNELPKTDVNIDDVKVSPPVFAGEIIAPEEEAPKLSLLQEYMLDRITFNEELGEGLKEGTEVVQFTVTPSGNVSDIKIINSVCSPIDKEVVRVLETTDGMWKPGYNNEEPVAMEKEVVLAFRRNYGLYGKSCSEYLKKKPHVILLWDQKRSF